MIPVIVPRLPGPPGPGRDIWVAVLVAVLVTLGLLGLATLVWWLDGASGS